MKNRYWAVALCVLVLVLALVSACGGGKESTTTATATATSTKTSTATTTPTQTKTATSTPTGNSLSNILGLGASINSVKYDATITTPGSPTVQMTGYDKNNKKFREEMTTQGQQTVILYDMDTGVMYMYMPDLNTATKMTLSSNMTLSSSMFPSVDPSSILDYNPQITGTETIDGKSCTVFTWEIPGSATMKEWIWTDKGFPLKIEATTSQGTIIIEYTNIDFSDIPDSMFELPAGVIITTSEGMPTSAF